MGLLLLTDFDVVRGADCCSDPITGGRGTILYLKGANPLSGNLSKDYPEGNYESVTIDPDIGLSRQNLGQWESQPLQYNWKVDSKIHVQIPAWGNGQSISTQFFIEVLVDGESKGEILTADDGMMYMYMYWLGNDSFSFTARSGQSIGINIDVIENGPGGEMRWDSEEAIGQVWIKTPSVIIEDVTDIVNGTNHESWMDAFSYWGEEDIDNIGMLIMDPAEMQGGPVWEDIVNNCTIYDISDSITIDWDDSQSGDGHKYGTWIWNPPDETTDQMEVVGFASDGGFSMSFRSTLVVQPVTTTGLSGGSSSGEDTPWMLIIGIMIVAGLGIASYQHYIMDHEIKRIIVVAGTIMITGIVLMSTFYNSAFSTGKQPAPDFKLQTLDDKTISLDDLDGKVIVLSLTGITCSFCEPQMREMVKVREKFVDNEGIFFLSINIMRGDDNSIWREFKNQIGADWDFAMDNDEMCGKFKLTSMPVIILIDEEGNIAYTHEGTLLKSSEFEDKINEVEEGLYAGGKTFTGGSLMFAFFVGVTAFFAPCAFPLLPGFMTFQLGKIKEAEDEFEEDYDDEDYYFEAEAPGLLKGLKLGIAALVGITGVMVTFALLGWVLEDSIQSIMKYYTPILGLIVAVLGIVFLMHIPLPTGNIRDKIVSSNFYNNYIKPKIDSWQGEDATEGSRHLGVMAYGAGYASASMGCHGPIFVAVLLIGLGGGFLLTLEMILLYALGMGICMVIVCILVAGTEDAVIEKIQEKLPLINKISGLFLIVAGIWIFWYGYQAFS